jgi:hypothetical protein
MTLDEFEKKARIMLSPKDKELLTPYWSTKLEKDRFIIEDEPFKVTCFDFHLYNAVVLVLGRYNYADAPVTPEITYKGAENAV